MAKKDNRKIAVFDLETDPFDVDVLPQPFAAGFFDGVNYWENWSAECVDRFVEYIKTIDEPMVIYAHNGGKFDFMFLLQKGYIENPIKIINGRLVSAWIGIHEIRDSYAILPVALAQYQKDSIDYNLFYSDVRDKHKNDILHYLSKDCEYLYLFVIEFIKKYDTQLTIGSAAIKTLKKFHPFKNQKENHDMRYRPFYFGGRVQCFERGEKIGNFKVVDVNSMYPSVMASLEHPTGKKYEDLSFSKIDEKGFYKGNTPYFINFIGTNRGAFPTRTKTGLDFNVAHGEFFATSHEFQVALKYNLVDVEKVISIQAPCQTVKFDNFVEHHMKEKIEHKLSGDKARELIAKLVQNSSYGKLGQNPANFFDYEISFDVGERFQAPWDLHEYCEDYIIWKKPAPKPSYYDVATAASITGAARAVLLEAMQTCFEPLYCDTDSIICTEFYGDMSPTQLGMWDLEATGNKLYLAGKKLYVLFDENDQCVKMASKGVRLSPVDIKAVALGETRRWESDAPSFKMDGSATFTKRNIVMR